jgi:hypothetical protein
MVGGSTNKLTAARFDQVDKKASTFNAAKFYLVGNNSTGANMFGRSKNSSLLLIIIVCICQFKYIIRSRLPKYSTLWCIIRDEHFVIWFYFFCINDCMSYFLPCCLTVSHFLDKVSAISLQMPDKICSPHICISLNNVCQEELIVGFFVATRQKEILSLISLCKRILVLILVSMSPSLYASIIFNVKLARKMLSMRHRKSKYSREQ